MAEGVAPSAGGGAPRLTFGPRRESMELVRTLHVLIMLTLSASLLAACGAGEEPTATPSPAAPSPVESASPLRSPSPEASPPPVVEDGRAGGLVLGLCAVERALEAGDVDGAEVTFEDEVHEPLHELADDTEGVDRGAAADVLEAKQRVEAVFAGPAPATELARDVATLLHATRVALQALGLEAPACSA